MKFQVRGKNLEVTNALREYAERKIGRLEKYFESPVTSEVQVKLSVERNIHKVEVTIPMPGVLLRAEERSEDMYASIDQVVDKLERQIRKYKTRINRKARQEGTLRTVLKESYEPAETASAAETVEEPFDVVKKKRIALKPMELEEAILQMDLLGHNFFVFADAATSKVNVVYRRNDGRYGLIEPAL